MSRSKIKVTGDKKNTLSAAITSPAAYEWYALTANSVQQQRQHYSIPDGGGVISEARVRCMFGKTSLALVYLFIYLLCHMAAQVKIYIKKHNINTKT